ncbi:MAG: hypothetical protein AAB444_03735 [Patescibacteria group bacterium]
MELTNDGRQGFTLVELLLYVGLSSLLLLTMTLFLSTLLESRVKNQTVAEVEQQGAAALHMMAQIIRNAESITSPIQGNNASSLTLNVITGANDPTVFDLSSDALRITEGAGSPMVLTNSRVTVSGLTFQNLSHTGTPGAVRVNFTLTHVNPTGRNEYQFQKTFTASATLRQP